MAHRGLAQDSRLDGEVVYRPGESRFVGTPEVLPDLVADTNPRLHVLTLFKPLCWRHPARVPPPQPRNPQLRRERVFALALLPRFAPSGMRSVAAPLIRGAAMGVAGPTAIGSPALPRPLAPSRRHDPLGAATAMTPHQPLRSAAAYRLARRANSETDLTRQSPPARCGCGDAFRTLRSCDSQLLQLELPHG